MLLLMFRFPRILLLTTNFHNLSLFLFRLSTLSSILEIFLTFWVFGWLSMLSVVKEKSDSWLPDSLGLQLIPWPHICFL